MFRFGTQALIAASLAFTHQAAASGCEDSFWPVYAGGQTGDERVNCFVYDPNEELLIVGGVTTSADFSPAPIEHGFLYALDLNSNWKWGRFFYETANRIASIDGCQMSSNGNSLAVTGMSQDRPAIMDVNTRDGTLKKFVSIVHVDADNPSNYENFGAIFKDESDYRDNKPYYYTSFIKDDEMFMLRVYETEFGASIDWNLKF